MAESRILNKAEYSKRMRDYNRTHTAVDRLEDAINDAIALLTAQTHNRWTPLAPGTVVEELKAVRGLIVSKVICNKNSKNNIDRVEVA